MPASIQATFQGTAAAFLKSLANEPILILAALVTVYIVLASSTKATFIRSPFSPPPVGGRRCDSRAASLPPEFSVIALIGIIPAHRHRQEKTPS